MSIPYINSIRNAVPMTQEFLGINKGERIGDGEWADAKNLTTEYYPVAKTRPHRVECHLFIAYGDEEFKDPPFVPGVARDAQIVDGKMFVSLFPEHMTDLVPNGAVIVSGLSHEDFYVETIGDPKEIVPFNRGVYTSDGCWVGQDGTCEQSAVSTRFWSETDGRWEQNPTFLRGFVELCDMDGNGLTAPVVGDGEPENPQNGDYWIDTTKNGLYKYSSLAGEWVSVPTAYFKILLPLGETDGRTNGVELFRKGDTIETEIQTDPGSSTVVGNNTYSIYNILPAEEREVTWRSGEPKVKTNYVPIVVRGLEKYFTDPIDAELGYLASGMFDIKVSRRAPVFDHIICWKNRIWGCRYGTNDKGEFVNEIYGSALGNCHGYFTMQGIASDSFVASVGTGGAFTGIAATEDNVIFFKEDRVYILSGTEPPFTIREKWGPSIPDGAGKSIVCVNGAIFFQSSDSFMQMDVWNYPTVISHNLGRAEREPFVGGRDGERIVWASPNRTLIYDNGAWMEEESLGEHPFKFLEGNGMPFCLITEPPVRELTELAEGLIAVFLRPGTEEKMLESLLVYPETTIEGVTATYEWRAETEGDFDWYGVTGIRGLSDPEPKRLNNIKIRLKTGANAAFRLFVELDEDGVWIPVQNEERTKTGTYVVRYVPNRRCDLYRLKIEGHGDCVIYSITESYENAGDGSVGL